MSLHQERTHPELVKGIHRRTHEFVQLGCFACKVSTIDIDYQSLSTRDHVRNNEGRTKRIIRARQEKHEGLTDLKVGRRADKADEDAVLSAANYDGNRPRSVY